MVKKTLVSAILIAVAVILFAALAFAVAFYVYVDKTGNTDLRAASIVMLSVFAAASFTMLFLVSLFGCYSFRYVRDREIFDVSKKASDGEGMTVMSFNLRTTVMQDLFKEGWYYRAKLVRQVIKEIAPDVIGFQEINRIHEHFLRAHLRGYSFFMAYRTNGPFKEGMMIAYRSDRFEGKDGGYFWLSETPDKLSKDWGTGSYRIAAHIELTDKKTGKTFTVMDTHLDNVSEEARAKGMKVILERKEKAGLGTMILMGDMNDIEDSPMYKLATKGLSDARKKTEDVYTGPGSTFHGFGRYYIMKGIDFFFVSPDVDVNKYYVYDKKYDGVYPSDHFPIVMNVNV